MSIREQIIYAIEEYSAGNYNTEAFCYVFSSLYFFETSGHRFFFGEEKRLLDKLAAVVERYSPFEDEIAAFGYFSEEKVKEKFNEIIPKLGFIKNSK